MEIERFFEITVDIVEVAAVATLLVGMFFEGGRYLFQRFIERSGDSDYVELRKRFARILQICLEMLVAADLIVSVAIDRSFESLGVLAILVGIRSVLGLTLEMELGSLRPVFWRPNRSDDKS